MIRYKSNSYTKVSTVIRNNAYSSIEQNIKKTSLKDKKLNEEKLLERGVNYQILFNAMSQRLI